MLVLKSTISLSVIILSSFTSHASTRSINTRNVLEIGQITSGALVVGLSARQVGIPTQCKPDCDPVNTAIQNICTPQDCCTAKFEIHYYNCLLCVGGAANVTDYTSAQQVLDQLQIECAGQGLSIPILKLPGQGISSSSTLSSTPASRPGNNITHSTQLSTPTSFTGIQITFTGSPSPVSSMPVPLSMAPGAIPNGVPIGDNDGSASSNSAPEKNRVSQNLMTIIAFNAAVIYLRV